jgi:hypothetical protein
MLVWNYSLPLSTISLLILEWIVLLLELSLSHYEGMILNHFRCWLYFWLEDASTVNVFMQPSKSHFTRLRVLWLLLVIVDFEGLWLYVRCGDLLKLLLLIHSSFTMMLLIKSELIYSILVIKILLLLHSLYKRVVSGILTVIVLRIVFT